MDANLPQSLADVTSPPPSESVGKKIIMFGDQTCADCDRVKQFFDDLHIDYEYHNISEDDKARAWVTSFTTIVPVLIMTDKSLMYEPSDEAITEKLGLKKASIGPSGLSSDKGGLYDVIIIGGGPGGVAAAVYTARKQLKTLLITESFGGQSIVSGNIHNWIGEKDISGLDLAKKLEAHVRNYPEMVDVKTEEQVTKVEMVKGTDPKRFGDFVITSDKGSYSGKTVIVTSGARRRKLGITGEDNFEGKGLAYCSTCDAPLFVGRKVVVVGGGNAGLEAVQDLFPYASEVYLMEYSDSIKGDPETFKEIKNNSKLKEIILNAKTLEVLGDTMVTGIKYQDTKSSQEKTLEVGGIFVEIGSLPNSEIVKELVQLDPHGQIMINFQHATTSHPGVFAAGDVTNDPYKQNNISVGDGVRAALAAYNYLLQRQKTSPAEEKHDIPTP